MNYLGRTVFGLAWFGAALGAGLATLSAQDGSASDEAQNQIPTRSSNHAITVASSDDDSLSPINAPTPTPSSNGAYNTRNGSRGDLDAKQTESDSNSASATDKHGIHEEVYADYSYVGGSQAKSGSTHFGDIEEQTSSVGVNVSIPINATLGLETGVGYRRIDFGNPGTVAATPSSLEAVVPMLGVRYALSKQWALFSRFSPEIDTVNGWSDSSPSVRLGGAVGALYFANPNLDFSMGLAINSGAADIPVMPIGGMRWHFADAWTLFVGFPKTAIEYSIDKKWKVWFGPTFEGGTFTTGDHYGNAAGRPNLDNQRFTYEEIRLGVGSEYRFNELLGLEAQAGGSLYRKFDFDDIDYKVTAQPAPYVEVGLKLHF